MLRLENEMNNIEYESTFNTILCHALLFCTITVNFETKHNTQTTRMIRFQCTLIITHFKREKKNTMKKR